MYKVLLADDEPIVLSGIKFLIDWERLGCQVTHTARNGNQAMDIIEQEHPDIVICDINMPMSSGLEVLKRTYDKPYAPSFIMLTNHQEFDMARESLRYKAVDYLLKTQLDAEILEKAVLQAIVDCENRRRVEDIHMMDEALHYDKSRILESSLVRLSEENGAENNRKNMGILKKNGVLKDYAIAQIILDFTRIPKESSFTRVDRQRVYECVNQFAEALLPKVFSDYTFFRTDSRLSLMEVYLWNLPGDYKERMRGFFEKLVSASANLTKAGISIAVTDRFEAEDGISLLFEQRRGLVEYYYRNQKPLLFYDSRQAGEYAQLQIGNQVNKLSLELNAKNIPQCEKRMLKIKSIFGEQEYTRKSTISCCVELFSTVAMVLASFPEEREIGSYFLDMSQMVMRINAFLTKEEVSCWLEEFQERLLGLLREMTGSRSELMDKVQGYILENIEERIMLQDVADYVNISPSYLSALFKKQYNQNLVDYINKCKMDRACELIREGKHKIYEISYLLSFENAYYFTKVFKRHMGMTPKEYQYKVRGDGTEREN